MIIRWNPNAGHLSISEQLLSQLGFPHVLIIERVGETGIALFQRGDSRISPDSRERKVRYHERQMPRIGISEPALVAHLRAGRYLGRVVGGALFAEPE